MIEFSTKLKKYIIGATLGLLTGSFIYLFQPLRWEGQAMVKIGQISPTIPIESMQIVNERLKSNAFAHEVAKRANAAEIIELFDVNKGNRLTYRPIKSNDAFIINVVADSPEMAQSSIDSVVAELIDKHKKIVNDYQSDIHKIISYLESEIAELQKRINILSTSTPPPNIEINAKKELYTRFDPLSKQLNLSMLEQKKDQRMQHLISVGSTSARMTQLLEPNIVLEKRLFPTLWRPCLLGALVGILLSMIWAQLKK